MGVLDLEIFVNHKWQKMGKVEIYSTKQSTFSKAAFEYDLEYFYDYAQFNETNGIYSASVNYPLGVMKYIERHWPGFLLDLIPQGAARKIICQRENLLNTPEQDFEILRRGAINPIGNIRIKNSHQLFEMEEGVGFKKEDLIEKNENFLEHAQSYGALVVGTSGAQGESLKFLVNTDSKGIWYCDGALKDSKINESFIVKLPRGKADEDRLILEAEGKYMQIAAEVGVNANRGVYFQSNVLFVPRIDRKIENAEVVRYGMESLSSVLNHHEFGKQDRNENIVKAIHKFSSDPEVDVLEYVRRDFLNIVMGNTDNHARNTALIKYTDSSIRLSPLFDFAPMVMDSSMIARSCKWNHEKSYIPNFEELNAFLVQLGLDQALVSKFFNQTFASLKTLPTLFKKYDLKQEVILRSTRKYEEFMDQLNSFNASNL